MIRTQLKYEEEAIKNLMSQAHFILEACVENELPEMDLAFTINSIKGHERSEQARMVIEALKTHKPVEIVAFKGMKKWSAEWWVAVVKLASHIKKDLFALLTGWTNVHGTSAIVSSYSDKEEDITEIFDLRTQSKVRQKYTEECVLANVMLDVAETLPELPGSLPLPEDLHMPKISSVAGLEEILTGLGHTVSPPSAPKAGKPKPKTVGKPRKHTTSLASEPEPEPTPEPTPKPAAQPKPELTPAQEEVKAKSKASMKKARKGRLTKEEKKQKLKESMRRREEESDW